MSFPAYPQYKESGVEWLGEVPEHWQILPLKRDLVFLTSGSRGWAEHYSEAGALFLRIGNLRRNSLELDFSERQFVEVPSGAEGERTKVMAGDVLFSITAYLGAVAVVPLDIETAYVSQHVALVRIGEKYLLPRWVGYVALSWVGKTYLESQGYGGTKVQLSLDDIANMVMTAPSLVEQELITLFLDHETARIDALIEEQQRLIELLKEKRQALISHAVTKGLDPTVPMKDSGVEWLGEVPAHWDVLNFNLLVYIAEGQVNPRVQPYSEMLLIAPNHVEPSTGRLIHTETAEEQGADSGKYACQKGDVIYSKIRPALRKVCLAPEACLCSADMYPMRGFSGLDNEYLFWFILSEPFSAFALLESDRVAMPKINRESLGGLKLARPPLEEQKAISEFIVRETLRIDALIDEANSGVGLLNERRSALISAAVTGKIDVRGWQPPAVTPSPESAIAEAH